MLRGARFLQPGAVCGNEALCSDAEATRSEFFTDWIAPQKHRYSTNLVLAQHRTLTSILGLIRPRDSEPFSVDDAAALKLLLPHLQRAVQLHQRITGLETAKQAAADALNHWSLGVILLNDKSQVLLMNRAAEAILKQKDGLTTAPDGLHAAFSEESATLRRLIRGAIATIAGEFACPGGSVALARPSGKRAWGVLVTPACLHKGLFPESSAACAVFVNDPEAGEKTNRDFLCRVFGLSRAEAGIASLLLDGKEVK
jgi:PAS domain-containing protein